MGLLRPTSFKNQVLAIGTDIASSNMKTDAIVDC